MNENQDSFEMEMPSRPRQRLRTFSALLAGTVVVLCFVAVRATIAKRDFEAKRATEIRNMAIPQTYLQQNVQATSLLQDSEASVARYGFNLAEATPLAEPQTEYRSGSSLQSGSVANAPKGLGNPTPLANSEFRASTAPRLASSPPTALAQPADTRLGTARLNSVPSQFGQPAKPSTTSRVIRVPRSVTQWVRDPNNPDRYTPVTTQVYETQIVEDRPSRELAKLLQQIRAVSPEEDRHQQLSDQIRKLVDQEFEDRHQAQIERLEKVLADARRAQGILSQRKEQQEQIVDRRVASLLGKDDPMNWNFQPDLPGQNGRGGFPSPNQFVPSDVLPPSGGATFQPAPTAPVASTQPVRPPQPATSVQPGYAPLYSTPASPSLRPSAPGGQLPPPSSAPEAALTPAPSEPYQQTAPNQLPSVANPPTPGTSLPGLQPMQPIQPAGPAVAANSPADDLVSAGFRLRGLQKKHDRLEKLVKAGAVHTSEFDEAANALEESQTQWQFKLKEAEGKQRIAELQLEIARDQITSFERELRELAPNAKIDRAKANRGLLTARRDAQIADVELSAIRQQLDWAKNFSKSLDVSQPDAADQPPELMTEENELLEAAPPELVDESIIIDAEVDDIPAENETAAASEAEFDFVTEVDERIEENGRGR